MMNLLKLFLSTFALLTVLQQQRAAASTHATLSPRCPSPSRATGIQRAAQGPPWDSLDYRSLDELPRPEPAEYERLLSLTASEAAAELCSRNVTAVAYARALLLRIRETECLNAWSAFDAARVLSDAAAIDSLAQAGKDVRPLCGLPVGAREGVASPLTVSFRRCAAAWFSRCQARKPRNPTPRSAQGHDRRRRLPDDRRDARPRRALPPLRVSPGAQPPPGTGTASCPAVPYSSRRESLTAFTPSLPPGPRRRQVTRLKQAHGVVLGKLRMHELGGGDTSLNPLYG